MSTKTISKIETRMVIGFDDETKATIGALKSKLDEVARGLLAKKESHADGLLAAMQAEGGDDAPQPELKELGQWVFEGQDEKWVSAAKDADNEVWLFQVPLKDLATNENKGYSCWYAQDGSKTKYLCDLRSNEDWKNSAIDRETVNDVYYLSDDDLNDSVPHIDDVLAQPNWLSDSVPQITQADLQLIFIKNLSNVLIQRMQTMDRFSDDDYAIGGDKLMAWDIVTGEYNNKVVYGVVAGTQGSGDAQTSKIDIVRLKPKFSISETHSSIGTVTNIYFDDNNTFRTITEAELPAFREALEACYV